MSKSVLLMDTPDTCKECPCSHITEHGSIECKVTRYMFLGEITERPNWCPMIEEPPHTEVPDSNGFIKDCRDSEKLFTDLLNIGFNTCLDLLEGKYANYKQVLNETDDTNDEQN